MAVCPSCKRPIIGLACANCGRDRTVVLADCRQQQEAMLAMVRETFQAHAGAYRNTQERILHEVNQIQAAALPHPEPVPEPEVEAEPAFLAYGTEAECCPRCDESPAASAHHRPILENADSVALARSLCACPELAEDGAEFVIGVLIARIDGLIRVLVARSGDDFAPPAIACIKETLASYCGPHNVFAVEQAYGCKTNGVLINANTCAAPKLIVALRDGGGESVALTEMAHGGVRSGRSLASCPACRTLLPALLCEKPPP